MVESAEMRKSDNAARVRSIHGAWLRALLVQGKMSSRGVVIGAVGAKHPTQMLFVENDQVVEAVSANRSDQPLDVGILPG